MRSAINKYKYPYLFILPFFVLFFVFQLVPLLWTIVISFTEWNGIGTPKNVGTANYIMKLIALLNFQNMIFVYIGAIVGGIIGAYIGKVFLKKHFEKAGII